MKKLFLSLLLLLPMVVMSQTRKVAILETVDKENTLLYGVKLMVRSHLAEAVTNTPGYEAYDRTNLQQIFDEQEFQRTGFVSDEDIKKIGEMTGVQYVLVAEASKLDERNLFITAKILNVETARVEKTANTMSATDIPSLQNAAQDLASRLLINKGGEMTNTEIVAFNKKSQGYEYIDRTDIKEYLIDGQVATQKEYYQFIKDNRYSCPQSFQEFQRGRKLSKIGWCLFGIGIPLVGAGIGTLFLPDGISLAGIIMTPIGGSMMLAGIPLLSVGYHKKNNAYTKFNESCAPKKTASVTLNLQSSRNGLGLALCF